MSRTTASPILAPEAIIAAARRSIGAAGGVLRVLIALLIASSLWVVLEWGTHRLTRRPAPEAAVRPPLRAWDALGCWRLRIDPWRDSVGTAAPEASTRAEGAPLDPPEIVLLLPDSVDRWGRELPSYRAVPLDEVGSREGRHLRWFVRADTLWLLWSGGGVRAGAALFRSGDSLLGAARTVRRADAWDGVARARAWPINCATLRRESSPERPAR